MATTKKNGLGKGLDSLITNKVNNAKTTTATTKPAVKKDEKVVEGILVNINKVEPNREQPRKNFDEDALLELAESIKQFYNHYLYNRKMITMRSLLAKEDGELPNLLI